jgi:hypothetical protein
MPLLINKYIYIPIILKYEQTTENKITKPYVFSYFILRVEIKVVTWNKDSHGLFDY